MQQESRREERVSMGGQFANKYIGGTPYMVELLDASIGGFRVRRISEPEINDDAERETFALEMCFEEYRFWAWAKCIRRDGNNEAYQILAADPLDRARLRKFLRTLAA